MPWYFWLVMLSWIPVVGLVWWRQRVYRNECEDYRKGHAFDTDDWGFQDSRRFERIERHLGLEKWRQVRASACHHGVGFDEDCEDCRQEEE